MFVAVPLAAIGAGGLAYFATTSPPPERTKLTERTAKVRVINARTQAVTPSIVGFGVINPARTYKAISQVGGTVENVKPALHKRRDLACGCGADPLVTGRFRSGSCAGQRQQPRCQGAVGGFRGNQTASPEIEKQALARLPNPRPETKKIKPVDSRYE